MFSVVESFLWHLELCGGHFWPFSATFASFRVVWSLFLAILGHVCLSLRGVEVIFGAFCEHFYNFGIF